MKVAIDTSPLSSGHAVRGIGFYTKLLVEALQKRHDGNEYLLIQEKSQLQTLEPDLIHYPYFDLFFPTAPQRNTVPVVVTLHDVTPLVLPKLFPKGMRGWLRLQSQLQKLHKLDAVITDSHASKTDIEKYCGVPTEKIHTVYLACDPSYKPETDTNKLAVIKQKYNLPEKYIMKVGDINKHKNFPILFQALSQLPDIHLVLPGKALAQDAPLINELQEINQLIEHYKLHSRVHRLGFVPTEDMNGLYSLARCTIQNSLYEGFGLPALESMTCGTPVIAGNTGSQPEVVNDAGILINPYNGDETIKAIEHMFELTDQEFNTLKQQSLQRAQDFSVEKMATETVAVYERFKK